MLNQPVFAKWALAVLVLVFPAAANAQVDDSTQDASLQITAVPITSAEGAPATVDPGEETGDETDAAHGETVSSPMAPDQFGEPAEAKSSEVVDKAASVPPPKSSTGIPAPFVSRSAGARTDSNPPNYVRSWKDRGLEDPELLNWLDFGLESVTRFELRRDLRKQNLGNDEQFLMQNKVFIGVHDILDPFRFTLEFLDARQFGSNYPENSGDVNEHDFLQAYAELYLKDFAGQGEPLSFRAGRMTLDLVDRRLVARNRWRNTMNAFDGFRLLLGDDHSPWQLDVFAAQPTERRLTSHDVPNEERWFYGAVGTWREWNPHIIVQPYYFVLDEDFKRWNGLDRDDRTIHTLGIHLFGNPQRGPWDYDMDLAFQFGEDGWSTHRAFAGIAEVGYTFEHAWKPRLSLAFAYATGDDNPDDNVSGRFDRLFEPTHPFSVTDLIGWQNIMSPKVRLAVAPMDKVQVTVGYGSYWLESAEDAWVDPGLRDPEGRSGHFIGQDVDIVINWRVHELMDIQCGYTHFFDGGFAERNSDFDDGDMLFVSTGIRF